MSSGLIIKLISQSLTSTMMVTWAVLAWLPDTAALTAAAMDPSSCLTTELMTASSLETCCRVDTGTGAGDGAAAGAAANEVSAGL